MYNFEIIEIIKKIQEPYRFILFFSSILITIIFLYFYKIIMQKIRREKRIAEYKKIKKQNPNCYMIMGKREIKV